jgi:hypothetical protein
MKTIPYLVSAEISTTFLPPQEPNGTLEHEAGHAAMRPDNTTVSAPEESDPKSGAAGPNERPECLTLSVPEAGLLYFGLKRNASYAAAARGDIPTIKVGRKLRALRAALDRRILR